VALSAVMVVTGAIGAITGGNSLVNVPLMIALGMSPREAVATNMFAVIFMTLSATVRFAGSKLIRRGLAIRLCLITAVTSAFGAHLAVKLPESVVKAVVGVSMALLVLFMAARPSVAARDEPSPPAAPGWGLVATFVLGIYGGFFSGGYTTLMTFVGVTCFGLTMLESVALMKPVNLVSCVAASIVFFSAGLVDFRVGIPIALANLFGGFVGAHWAVKANQRVVRGLFLATVAALAMKLLAYDVVYRSWLG
jgi:uncharacterized membrane protein YfcA